MDGARLGTPAVRGVGPYAPGTDGTAFEVVAVWSFGTAGNRGGVSNPGTKLFTRRIIVNLY